MDEARLRLETLERVALAAREWSRNPRSLSAQRGMSASLDELDDLSDTAVEPTTRVVPQPSAMVVRAAVAVAPGGRYSIYGSSEEDDDNVVRNHVYARLCHVENCTVHFVEAVVPVATEVKVWAEVDDAIEEIEEMTPRSELRTESPPGPPDET